MSNAQNYPTVIGDSVLGTDYTFYHKDICLDQENNLWIGYYHQGVAKYDGANFTHFTAENSELESNTVNDIYSYSNNIYISTDSGVFKSDITTNPQVWELVDCTYEYTTYTSYINNNNLYVLAGIQDTARKIIILNLDTNESQEIEFEPYYFNYTTSKAYFDIDAEDNIYWSSRNSYGIFKYDGIEVSKIIEEYYNEIPLKISSFIIVDNEIWYSIKSKSIYIYNILNSETKHISETNYYDSQFGYYTGYLHKDENNRILIISPHSNFGFTEICLIENDNTSIYKFTDISLLDIFATIIFGNDNNVYFSSRLMNQLYFYNLDNYQNFMSGYTDDNFKHLDRNFVKAGVRSYGTLFWDGKGHAQYEVPAGNDVHSLFALSFCIGGKNTSNNELHLSAERFNQGYPIYEEFSGFDFLPGPLTDGSYGPQAFCDTSTSVDFNKIWKIDKSDILAHISNIENGTEYYVSPDLYSWPGNGPTGYSEQLAPYFDSDSDGIYEPNAGDYPLLKGDQMLWWITNDIIAPHTETDGTPMGVELQYTLYGYYNEDPVDDNEDLINYQSFLNLKITNRSINNYDSVFCSIFTDADLGYAGDDHVGCDVERSSFYFYNGDDFDETADGQTGYGETPPIQTITILDGPFSHPENSNVKLGSFMYFVGSSTFENMTDPHTAMDFYNYSRGYWLDNTPLCYGGMGHSEYGGDSDTPTSYMLPGSPTSDPMGIGQGGVPQAGWSEETIMTPGGDRRGVGGIGPFDLDSEDEIEVDILFGYLPCLDTTGTTGFFDFGPQLDSLISWYNNGTIPSNYNPELFQGFDNISNKSSIKLYPNPTTGIIYINAENITNIAIYSIDGKLIQTIGNSSEIDLSQFQNGVYLISIETVEGCFIEKIIKK